VTVGTREQNSRFLAELRNLLKGPAGGTR
jgi:histidinol-phosphate/aromatic aminotransferase/cobyric acid decarboxylase-like protein